MTKADLNAVVIKDGLLEALGLLIRPSVVVQAPDVLASAVALKVENHQGPHILGHMHILPAAVLARPDLQDGRVPVSCGLPGFLQLLYSCMMLYSFMSEVWPNTLHCSTPGALMTDAIFLATQSGSMPLYVTLYDGHQRSTAAFQLAQKRCRMPAGSSENPLDLDGMLYERLAATKPPCLGCLGPIPKDVLPPVLGQVRLMLSNLVKPAEHSDCLWPPTTSKHRLHSRTAVSSAQPSCLAAAFAAHTADLAVFVVCISGAPVSGLSVQTNLHRGTQPQEMRSSSPVQDFISLLRRQAARMMRQLSKLL